ncbi:MAG: protein O-mannosyl-transferase family [bacterium]
MVEWRSCINFTAKNVMNIFERELKKVLIIVVMVIAGIVYLFTVAPTLSFWDCGEFITSAYTLAIPHPPGTPFYVILGRVWLIILGIVSSILPISKEIAWHMNLLAIFFSLGSIFLIYKITLKILALSKTGLSNKGIWSAFIGTMGIPFYFSIWWNAVETEVYAPASFVFVLINYLVVLWYEGIKKGQPKNYYLLLSFYLIFLATGIHLVPFLSLIPIYIFVYLAKPNFLKDRMFLLIGIFQIVIFAYMFLLPDSLLKPALVLLVLTIISGVVLSFSRLTTVYNRIFFWAGVFLVFAGLSSELYLPLRSKKLTELYKDEKATEQYLKGKNIAPRINMNEPGTSLSSFFGVLHRSQYGVQKIIPRQTQAQGANLIQGVFYQVALFIRYLSQQIAPEYLNGFLRILLLLVFYVLIINGLLELYRREHWLFVLLILIIFFVSIGVVGYLNLKFSPSDSNPAHQPREVRERDYFFHTSFLYIGLLIAFGLLGFFEHLKRNGILTILITSTTVYSIVPVFFNFSLISRYKNFIPRDYGYNLLVSCAPNAIIFTNGDNDTFPLWFVQEVLGIRRDVIVANLSLINTDWYIRHLKHWGVPVSFDYATIEKLCNQGYFVTPDRRVMFVKDIMIRDILGMNAEKKLNSQDYFAQPEEFAHKYLLNYKGKKPIYFSSTVDNENYKGFDPYLRIEGIVYRVTGDSSTFPKNIDIRKTEELFYEKYRYTGYFSPDKYEQLSRILRDFEKRKKEGEFPGYEAIKDQNTVNLYFNYAIALIYFGFLLRDNNDLQGALNAWRLSSMFESMGTEAWKLYYNLGMLFNRLHMVDSAEKYFQRIEVKEPQIYTQIGESFRFSGEYQKAIEYFQEALRINPRNASGYMGLIITYLDLNDTNSAVKILQDWIKFNPDDTSARILLKTLKNP